MTKQHMDYLEDKQDQEYLEEQESAELSEIVLAYRSWNENVE
jgi:hypothetical protein